jgi:hypothetical protein
MAYDAPMTTPTNPPPLSLRNKLLNTCWASGADANQVLQTLLDVLMISIVAASASPDAAERNARAIADDMIANARRAHEEFHAMHEGLRATRQ